MSKKQGKRPTLRQVADLAGVSISTASRAISDHPDVGAESRAKVSMAIKALGYRPSLVARGLVSGRTQTLALLVCNLTDPFYPKLANAVEAVSNNHDFALFMCNTYDNYDRSLRVIDRLLRQGVDGVIHASIGRDEDLLQHLLDNNIAVVLANRRPTRTKNIDIVAVDNEQGARQGTRHLMDLGHRCIAFIASHEGHSQVADARLDGFRRVIEPNNPSFDPSLIQLGGIDRQSGYRIGRSLLTRTPRPTAIFAVNDVVALGVMDIALELGLGIPDDVSILGFDNIEPSGLGLLRLSTIEVPIDEMGKLACERLIAAVTKPEKHVPREFLLETQVVERDTVGRPPD